MNFSKYLFIFVLIILTVLSTANASSINQEYDIEKGILSHHNQVVTDNPIDEVSTNKDNAGCSHWGLKRWFCGIAEYFQRCLCCTQLGCMEKADKDRQYHVYYSGSENLRYTTDCFGIAHGKADDWAPNCCNNPCTGTLCAPLVLLEHLCCLPFQLCKKNVTHERVVQMIEFTPYYQVNNSSPILYQGNNEEFQRNQMGQAWALRQQQEQAAQERQNQEANRLAQAQYLSPYHAQQYKLAWAKK